jgi:hypothetical protein
MPEDGATMADLPEDGPAQVGPVPLPEGKRVTAGHGDGRPVAWATSEPVPDSGMAWAALSDLHIQTGLVPLLLAGLDDHGTRPWDQNEFTGPADMAEVDQLSALGILAAQWDGRLPAEAEDQEAAERRAPFGRHFPGLAPAQASPLSQAQLRQAVAGLPAARLGLVAASRPADVPALIGWAGSGKFWNTLHVAAVLRSWEARFGARLLRVGFGEMNLLVERPPRTLDEAQRVAAEHVAFCDECGGTGLTTVHAVSASLVDAPIWTFRWDWAAG